MSETVKLKTDKIVTVPREDLLTRDKAAELFNTTTTTLAAMASRGEITRYRANGDTTFYRKSELEKAFPL